VPIDTWRYPTPSGDIGHAILTQLPSSRVTSSTVPRRTVPTVGLPVLGDRYTVAVAVLTVIVVSCAKSHEGLKQITRAAAAA
jgi:hypothetical protein